MEWLWNCIKKWCFKFERTRNIIGTNYQQTVSIGNELCGLIIERDGRNNRIGGTQTGEGNIFAYNQIGVSILSSSNDNQISGNIFYCNENAGIDLSSDANNQQTAPFINVATVSVINGTGQADETIEVYLMDSNCTDGPCQGSQLIGITTVSNNIWRLDAPFLKWNCITRQ